VADPAGYQSAPRVEQITEPAQHFDIPGTFGRGKRSKRLFAVLVTPNRLGKGLSPTVQP
jgi:hypothetical protein